MGFRPSFGCQILHLPVGRRWQAGEDVPQISEGIDATAAAVLNHRVDDGAALPRGGFADEQPVLLAHRRGANRVLDQVMPPPDLCRVVKLEAHIPGVPEVIDIQHAA